MTDKVIILPPAPGVKEARLTVSVFRLANAVSTDEQALANVECVSIRGYMQYVTEKGQRRSWEGHDIAKMVEAYPDNKDVQAIAPLWQDWGKHASQPFTGAEKTAVDAAVDAQLDPFTAVKDAEATKTPLAKTVDTYVEPIDAKTLTAVKAAFGI